MYATLMGYSDRRPVELPPLDRAALMRDAHHLAKIFRRYFSSYSQALSYGLTAAWNSANSRREIQSLNLQAGKPTAPFTSAQIAASRRATRRCGSSLWAS